MQFAISFTTGCGSELMSPVLGPGVTMSTGVGLKAVWLDFKGIPTGVGGLFCEFSDVSENILWVLQARGLGKI